MVIALLLIYVCSNDLSAGMGDPSDLIYPGGYGYGEIPHPQRGMEILVGLDCFGEMGMGWQYLMGFTLCHLYLLRLQRPGADGGGGHTEI